MNKYTYDEARNHIKDGDIVALSHYSWASWYDLQVQAVRIFTRSEYCHVGQVWSVGGRLFMLEAVRPKVRMVPLSQFAAEGFYWISIGIDMSKDELNLALSKVGVAEYSRKQAILGGLNLLKIGQDRMEQCAEYVITNRRRSGVDLGNEATPSAVVHAALSMGYPLRFVKGGGDA